MEKCNTLLIAEPQRELAGSLMPWAEENGHRLLAVDNLKDLLMTLQSEKVMVLVMDDQNETAWAIADISVFDQSPSVGSKVRTRSERTRPSF